jgi:hypothetical protein
MRAAASQRYVVCCHQLLDESCCAIAPCLQFAMVGLQQR